MKLYKRSGSPYWWADLTVAGRRKRVSTRRTTKAEAREVAASLVKRELDADQLGTRETLALDQAVARYVETLRGTPDERTSTQRAFKLIGHDARGEPTGKWHLDAHMPLHRLTTAEVEQLRRQRRQEGLSAATINREVATLQRIYNLARLTWGVQVVPDVRFEKFRTRSKLRYLTVDEERRLLNELDPTRDIKGQPPHGSRGYSVQRKLDDQYDLVVFLLDTGCRYSEVATISWDCVDFETGVITVYRSKVDNEGTFSMTARLRHVLERRRGWRLNGPYVFPGYGTDGPRGHATGGIRKAIERAGLNAPHLVERFGRCTVHSFRDTFASRLVQAGVSLFKVQKLLGHSSPVMTQKYAHLAPNGAAEEAVGVLDALHMED